MSTGNRQAPSAKRWVSTVAAAATVPAVTGAFLTVAASPAGAACAGNEWAPEFATRYVAGGACVDVNFQEATEALLYRAWMRTPGDPAFEGSGGWLYRSQSTTDLVVAHKDAPEGKEYFVQDSRSGGAQTKVHVLT
jgi:hypothetical protein